MPKPPKLHLDEHLSPRLAAELRKYGFDVTCSQEVGLLSQPDPVQLAFAVSEERAILTFNFSDFTALYSLYSLENREHWGIILSTRENTGVLLQRLVRLLYSLSADDLKNQLRWLNEFK